jgi:hypothetical protein
LLPRTRPRARGSPVLARPDGREHRLRQAPAAYALALEAQLVGQLPYSSPGDARGVRPRENPPDWVSQQRADFVRGLADDALRVYRKPRRAARGDDVPVVQVAVQEDGRGRGAVQFAEERFGFVEEPRGDRAALAAEERAVPAEAFPPVRD